MSANAVANNLNQPRPQNVQNNSQVNSNSNDDANISLCGRIYRAVKNFFTAIRDAFVSFFKGVGNFLKNWIFKPIVNFPGKVYNSVKNCLGFNKKVEGEESPKTSSSSSQSNSRTNSRVASPTGASVKQRADKTNQQNQPGNN